MSLDDKHSISVGEPNAAVASLDRGRRVLTSSGTAVVALHSHKVIDIIDQLHSVQPILAVYTDGGPDHRPTFLSVQLSWIALFRKLKLVAVRTAPGQSFINPVERVMSLLNVALYGVSLERTRMDDQYETIFINVRNPREGY